jgi:hypothetical protein
MQFAEFPEANDVLKASPGTEHYVNDLPIYRQAQTTAQLPCVVSCARLSPEELAEVNRTGVVYLQVIGHTHPPVSLHGINPFVPAAEAPAEPTK